MTAGAEVVCNDVVDEKCVAAAAGGGLSSCDLNGVGDVAVDRSNVGGNGGVKDETDDSSYVFVGDGVEVIADDTGGVNVDVDYGLSRKSESDDVVDLIKKEELGTENGEIGVDSVVSESNGVDNGSVVVSDSEVHVVKDDMNLENGSTVDSVVSENKDIDNGCVVVSDSEVHAVRGDVNLENGATVVVLESKGFDNGSTVDSVVLESNGIGNGSVIVSDSEVNAVKNGVNLQNGSTVDSVVLESKGVDNGSVVENDSEVNVVKDDVNLENGSTVDPVLVIGNNGIAQDVNGHLDKISVEEEEAVVESTEEVEDANEIQNVENGMDDVGSVVTFEPESTLSTIENSPVIVSESDSITQSVSMPDVISTADESLSTPPSVISNTNCEETVDKAECQVIVDESAIPSEDLQCKVTADGSESSVSPSECHVTVEESGMPSGDSSSQVTADEPESIGSPIQEQECKTLVNGSGSIGSLVDYQESPVLIESEASANHTEEVEGKLEEHQESLVVTSEINAEAEPIISGAIEGEHQSVLSEDTAVLANGHAEKVNGILEASETHFSGTEAERSVLLTLSSEEEKSEDEVETQMEGSSEALLEVADSVEIEANSEDMKEQVNKEDEIQESQIAVTENVPDDANLEDNTTEFSNEAEVAVETETNIEPIIDNLLDKPEEGFRPEANSENVETVDPVISECKDDEFLAVQDNDSLSNPDESAVVEQKAEISAHPGTENGSLEDMDCGTGIENADDNEIESEVKVSPVEYAPHVVTEHKAAESMDCGTGVENVDVTDDEEKIIENKDAPVESEGMDCGTGIESVYIPGDEEKVTESQGHSTLSFSDIIVNGGGVIEFGSIGRQDTSLNIQKESEDNDVIQSDEILTSAVEDSVIDSSNAQNEADEGLQYNFMIKIPRYEDESYRDQIKSAQLLVEEKTRLRDALRVESQGKRANMSSHKEAYNAAKAEETAARRLIRLKRQEIDSVQAVINKWKNAMSVQDIDGRIYNMEHMIQHETLLLKDEKQFIREIKQLKTLRDQLASNMGSPEEIRQAIDQKDHNEERMKTLRKELDSLKDKASKAEGVVKTVGKTHDEEIRRERELYAQFRAADDVRQKAYAHLNSLRKQAYDKNKPFHEYREKLMTARGHASNGNKKDLHDVCKKQVENFMEQWNNNDEFREEYVSRCNMNANRRQRALDVGPLVPDDMARVLPDNVDEKVGSGPVKSVSVVVPVEEGKIVPSTENKHTDDVSGQKNQRLKSKAVTKPSASESDDMAVVTELAVENIKEEVDTPTKEEIESAKKAEELRKEEIAAKLKEQRRLEEKAKAIEALERKKRNAEKAQIRAELRARKEAEQKEKEREKRLRKKEKKKTGGGDGSMNGEEAVASSESANEVATEEIETLPKEKIKKKALPPPRFYSKQLKSKPIPPPLVNRNKKRWQQWGKYALAVVSIFVLFLLGNTSYLRLKFSALI